MSTVAELILSIVGKDETKGALDSATGNVDKLKNGISGLNKGLAVGGTALAATAGVALKLGSDFDSAFDEIQVATGASGDKLAGLQDDFRKVFESVPVGMGEASKAVAELASATGTSGPELQKLAENALNLSRITGTDLSTNITAITQLTNNWGLSGSDSAEAMDKLFVASQNTGQSVADIAKGVTDASSTFREMGFSLDDSIALVASLGKAGIDSNTAIGGLTKAVGKFAKEGVDAKTGISQTFDAIKNAKTDTEATALAVETFGAKAGPKLAEQIRAGKFEVDDLHDYVVEAGGAIQQTAADTDDWAEKLTIWKNKAILAVEPVTSKVFALTNTFVNLGPGIIALGPAFAGASKGFQAISTAATLAKAPLLSMGMALITPPLGIIIALVAVGVAAYVFRDQIIGAFTGAWEGIRPIVIALRDNTVGALSSVIDWTKKNWPIIATVIAGPFAPIVALATDAFGVRSKTEEALQGVLNWTKQHWPEIVTILSGPVAPLVALATDAFGIRTAFGNAISGVLTKAGQIASGIKHAFTDIDWLGVGTHIISEIVKGISGYSLAKAVTSKIPGAGSVGSALGSLNPFRAEGGPVLGGMPYIVGERGPELFVPQASGAIIPNGQFGGAGGLTLNFYGNVSLGNDARGREQLAQVGFAVKTQLRSRGVKL